MRFLSSVLKGASSLVRSAYSSVADGVYGLLGGRSSPHAEEGNGSVTSTYDPRSAATSTNGHGNRNPTINIPSHPAKSIDDIFGSGPEPGPITTNDNASRSFDVDASEPQVDLGTYEIRGQDQERSNLKVLTTRGFYGLDSKSQEKIEKLVLRKYNAIVERKIAEGETKYSPDEISAELTEKIIIQSKGEKGYLSGEMVYKIIRNAITHKRIKEGKFIPKAHEVEGITPFEKLEATKENMREAVREKYVSIVRKENESGAQTSREERIELLANSTFTYYDHRNGCEKSSFITKRGIIDSLRTYKPRTEGKRDLETALV